MNRLLTRISWVWFGFFLVTGCISKKDKIAYSPDDIYPDYLITANEAEGILTVLLHFRDIEQGESILLPAPATASLDGDALLPDSAKIGGYFYEQSRSIPDFTGKHELIYTDINNKTYRHEFEFEPLVLLTELTDTLDGNSLALRFKGLGENDRLYVVYRDTSLLNDDSRRDAEPGSSELILLPHDFESLRDGPIQMEFIRETRTPLQQKTPAGGKFVTRYVIQREFFLQNRQRN